LTLLGLVVDASAGSTTANEPVASIALNLWSASAFFGTVEAVRRAYANSGFADTFVGKSSCLELERVKFFQF
jgi:hypothetical protein